MATIHTLVEGLMDEAVAAKLIKAAGHVPGTCYGLRGCGYIKKKVRSYNRSAKSIYYLTLIDLMDTGETCAPDVVSGWVPEREPKMIVRIVTQELESWLLADREGIARFLKIDLLKVPATPERLADPKHELIRLARRSRNKSVREAIVPEPNSIATVGKLYTSEMIRFVSTQWDAQKASLNAPSLKKCLLRLKEIPTG
jgi:hypothetical protein